MPPVSLRCKECSTEYPLEAQYACERCFGPLEVAYSARLDADPSELRRRIQAGPQSLWRYSDFLPVRAPRTGVLPAGFTPLLRVDRLAEQLGLREIWIKTDAANPTHSFKDRVVSIAIAGGSSSVASTRPRTRPAAIKATVKTNVLRRSIWKRSVWNRRP